MINSNTVLVVDDDPAHRTMLRTLLTGWGYRIKEADDGAGAIAVVMIIIGRKFWQAFFNLSLIMTKLRSWKTAFSDFGSVQTLKSTSQLLPYGVPLSIGTLLVMFSRGASWWTF